MTGQSAFLRRAARLGLLGAACAFVCTALAAGQLDIIQRFSTAAGGGWSQARTALPATLGSFAAAPAAALYCALSARYGVRRTLIPCLLLTALGCVGVAAARGMDAAGGAAQGVYWLYFASMLALRSVCVCLPLACFQLAVNWFEAQRGRALGVMCAGVPIFYAVGTPVFSNLVAGRLGGDYRALYLAASVLLTALAVLVRLCAAERPEAVGMFPDGAPRPPDTRDIAPRGRMSLLALAGGAPLFVLCACMGSMPTRFMELGGLTLWLGASRRLAVGVILGIPAGALLGALTDRRGVGPAAALLSLLSLVPVISLWRMPTGGGVWPLLFWGVGAGLLLGGAPVLLPAGTAHLFGREGYPAAAGLILPAALLPAAAAAPLSRRLLTAGQLELLYGGLAAVGILGLVAALRLWSLAAEDAP